MRKVAGTLRPSLIAAFAAFILPIPGECAEIEKKPISKPHADALGHDQPNWIRAGREATVLAQGEKIAPEANGDAGADLKFLSAKERLAALKMPSKSACPLNGGDEPILAPVAEGGACAISQPVRLESIGPGGSIELTGGLLLDCEFTRQVETFIADTLTDTALIQLGARLTGVTVSASYLCLSSELPPSSAVEPEVVGSTGVLAAQAATRPIDETSAAASLQHALGRAIDITAMSLGDGRVITIASEWGKDTAEGRFLEVLHAKACREFSTVLGPDAGERDADADGGGTDGAALHLDNACAGEGCTARVCD